MVTVRELPSKGRCLAAFLLIHTAALRRPTTLEVWIEAASKRSTLMAAATDLKGTADMLLGTGLVLLDGEIVLNQRIACLCKQADRFTFLAIAQIFLEKYPPAWIFSAVSEARIALELIPQDDLSQLEWLGEDLIPLLLSVYEKLVNEPDHDLRKMLGCAGELAVMSALQRKGFNPTYVALISDAYGYDIENSSGGTVQRLEIKAAVEATATRVFVSRNEFDKAAHFGECWQLVQVIFSSRALISGTVTAKDVHGFRCLSGATLHSLAPRPKSAFKWVESAEFHPKISDWVSSDLEVDSDFSFLLIDRNSTKISNV